MSKKRCEWSENSFKEYIDYHDNEWGLPVHDEIKHFEFLTLEGAQAGLSWSTIIKKREGYRKAFDGFDPEIIARYDDKKIEELLQDSSIIRNRLKILSTVSNAQAFLNVQEEFECFDNYIWGFTDGEPIVNEWRKMSEVPAYTPLSDKISKDLKKRGFKFVGTTIIYAHMQAIGIVNDHTVDCFRYAELTAG